MILSSVKNYRSTVFTLRMNILSSIPLLRKGHLLMSFPPIESHLAIMESVILRQSIAKNRLTFAKPASILLSYYESRLPADAITESESFLLTLNVPLSSHQFVFTLLDAKLIPIPLPDDPQTALTWNIEAPNLGLFENEVELFVSSEEQLEHCLD